jgi:hypothetical protein
LAIVTNVGTGCGGRGSVRRVDVFAGRLSVSEHSATDERRLNAFAVVSAGRHLAGRCLWRRKLRTAKPCGPGARGWRQAGGGFSGLTGFDQPYPPVTEARGIRLRGEHGISRKAIAQGMPGCSGCTCMLVCALLKCTLHTRPRVLAGTRHSLRPLSFVGGTSCIARTQCAAGMRGRT